MDYQLSTPVQYLKGVGPQLGARLEGWGVKTLDDLIQNIPRAYQNWKRVRSLQEIREGDSVYLQANILQIRSFRRGFQKSYEIILEDKFGSKFLVKFFRQPYHGYFDQFHCPQMIYVVGKAQLIKNKIEFHHPDLINEVEIINHQDQIIPIYTETTGINSRKISKLVEQSFKLLDRPQVWQSIEVLPKYILEKYHLVSRQEALKNLHFPQITLLKDYELRRTEGHRRLIFEELFWMEFTLEMKRKNYTKEKASSLVGTGDFKEKLKKSLPFQLTLDQEKTINEISLDLKKNTPMNRLLQGDVGSGKTMVMFFSLLQAIEAGSQVAIMTPTEILSEQHYKNTQKLFAEIPINVALLTSKTKANERKKILTELENGTIHLLIGTHSLIEKDVKFLNLGYILIDEQHRFGVAQRFSLQTKGISPHRLLVTATPIPRTLAMTVYGDLDVSVLREKPPGRTPIVSKMMEEKNRPLMMQFLLKQIESGRQAYIVYPLVEENEKMDLKSAIESYEKLKSQFPKIRWGLLHGKMKSEEKDKMMTAFRRNEIQILLSTTVIEVGVDVPNAVIMLIEHSERFGLSQLHQLRGRVGRGSLKSYCIFAMGNKISREAKQRINLMCETEDGFKIAEADLKWRGAGEFLGSRQSGLAGFRWADLIKDEEILIEVRMAVQEIFKSDPDLKQSPHQILKNHWQSLPWSQTS